MNKRNTTLTEQFQNPIAKSILLTHIHCTWLSLSKYIPYWEISNFIYTSFRSLLFRDEYFITMIAYCVVSCMQIKLKITHKKAKTTGHFGWIYYRMYAMGFVLESCLLPFTLYKTHGIRILCACIWRIKQMPTSVPLYRNQIHWLHYNNKQKCS